MHSIPIRKRPLRAVRPLGLAHPLNRDEQSSSWACLSPRRPAFTAGQTLRASTRKGFPGAFWGTKSEELDNLSRIRFVYRP